MASADPTAAPSRALAYGLLPLVVLLWGANWPIMKVGLGDMPPLWFSATRASLGAISLFAFLALAGKLAIPTRRDLPVVLSVGIFQMALQIPLANFGLQHVPAGRAAVLVYTTPLWVAPGAVLFLGERLTRGKLAGLALGLCGVMVLFNPFGLDWSNRDVLFGSFLLMLAAMSWGIAVLHIRGHGWHHSALQLTAWQLALASLLLLPAAIVFEDPSEIQWNGTLLAVILYNGFVATAFCFWAAISISRALPAITSSLSFLAVPVVGLIASQSMLGEKPDWSLLVGFGLILGGVALVNFSDWRDASNDLPAL